MSNFNAQDNKNSEHNVFSGIPAKPKQEDFFSEFLNEQDISSNTIEALILDIRKFAKWFTTANQEPWDIERVTIRDVSDFKEHLRTEKQQAASTINRNLASIRKYFKWLFTNKRIIIKVGTSVLSNDDDTLNVPRLQALAEEIHRIRSEEMRRLILYKYTRYPIQTLKMLGHYVGHMPIRDVAYLIFKPFVGKKKGRLADRCACLRDSLLGASRELSGIMMESLFQPYGLKESFGAFFACGHSLKF